MSIRILRPRALPLHTLRSSSTTITTFPSPFLLQSRSFTDSTPETLSATRTLPYPTLPIFDIITSIDSYPDFIPFCTHAHITSYSNPDHHYNRKWPQRASLTVGYGTQFNESFTSRVYCVPPILEQGRSGVGMVEAISGSAEHGLDPEMIKHHFGRSDGANDTMAGPMSYLKTRWTVKNFPFKPSPSDGQRSEEEGVQAQPESRQMTDVSLTLEYKFSNPVYDMMSKALSGKIADRMIEAFVKRVEDVLKNNTDATRTQEKRFGV